MDDKRLEDRVREYQWPDISPEVRQRVMAVAVARAEPLTWSDRVWFSRTWRVAAAAAVVVVIALDQLTGVTPQYVAPTPQVMAEAQAIEAMAREAGLSEQTAAWLAQRALFDASRPKRSSRPGAALLQILELDTTGGM
jgi:hypothetical protein